jgi:hypothetical protein
MRFAELNVAQLFFIFGVLMGMFFGARIVIRLFQLSQSWGRGPGTDPAGQFVPGIRLRGTIVLDFFGWVAAVVITEIATRYW